jgi:hypothetical protein
MWVLRLARLWIIKQRLTPWSLVNIYKPFWVTHYNHQIILYVHVNFFWNNNWKLQPDWRASDTRSFVLLLDNTCLTLQNCTGNNNTCESPCKPPNPCTLSWRHGGTGAHFHKELVPAHVHISEKTGYKLFPWRSPTSTLTHTLSQHLTMLWTFCLTRSAH